MANIERIEVVGGLFQPISDVLEQPPHQGDITELKHTCRVCGKDIFGDSEFCTEDGGED